MRTLLIFILLGVATFAEPVTLKLHRTPPVHANDTPATVEIDSVTVDVVPSGSKSLVRVIWKDPSKNTISVEQAKNQWQSGTFVKQTGATDRFVDACAVMVPVKPVEDGVYPSLQMGDAARPVTLYFYDGARGAAVMEAAGRGTTRRTGQSFPAKASYASGVWTVEMELPALASGTPLSVAIWNGGQSDRDGRKYFSIWHTIR
jgi:hypothetical protein